MLSQLISLDKAQKALDVFPSSGGVWNRRINSQFPPSSSTATLCPGKNPKQIKSHSPTFCMDTFSDTITRLLAGPRGIFRTLPHTPSRHPPLRYHEKTQSWPSIHTILHHVFMWRGQLRSTHNPICGLVLIRGWIWLLPTRKRVQRFLSFPLEKISENIWKVAADWERGIGMEGWMNFGKLASHATGLGFFNVLRVATWYAWARGVGKVGRVRSVRCTVCQRRRR